MAELPAIPPARRRFCGRLLALAAIAGVWSPRLRADGQALWRVGFLANYPPFSFVGPDRQLHGFDFEVVRRLGELLGVRLQTQAGTMVDLQRRLKAGEIDFIGNQLLMTPENRQEYDFARSFAVNQLVCVQHEDDHRDFLGLDDLYGRKVGVLAHTGVEDQVRQAIGKGTVAVARIREALQLLAEKRLDAVLEESLIVEYHIEHERLPIKTTAPFAPPLRIGLALPKGGSALQGELDAGIARLLKDPAFVAISTRWFGFDVSHHRASPATADD